MSRFQIDFFELAFLAESCIPPRPIARSMFWDKLIDVYWEYMSEDERIRLWEWLNKNWVYKNGLEECNEQVLMFEARYNPDNQYAVKTTNEKSFQAFLFDGKYYINKNRWIDKYFIEKITKLKLK